MNANLHLRPSLSSLESMQRQQFYKGNIIYIFELSLFSLLSRVSHTFQIESSVQLAQSFATHEKKFDQ